MVSYQIFYFVKLYTTITNRKVRPNFEYQSSCASSSLEITRSTVFYFSAGVKLELFRKWSPDCEDSDDGDFGDPVTIPFFTSHFWCFSSNLLFNFFSKSSVSEIVLVCCCCNRWGWSIEDADDVEDDTWRLNMNAGDFSRAGGDPLLRSLQLPMLLQLLPVSPDGLRKDRLMRDVERTGFESCNFDIRDNWAASNDCETNCAKRSIIKYSLFPNIRLSSIFAFPKYLPFPNIRLSQIFAFPASIFVVLRIDFIDARYWNWTITTNYKFPNVLMSQPRSWISL